MAATALYWTDRYDANTQMYACPEEGCGKTLKCKLSNSAKNPGRTFVSCSSDYGGCGMFCFLNEEPKYLGRNNNKKARTDNGTQVLGPIVNQPQVHEQRLGELATEVAELRKVISETSAKLDAIYEYITQ